MNKSYIILGGLSMKKAKQLLLILMVTTVFVSGVNQLFLSDKYNNTNVAMFTIQQDSNPIKY